MEGGEMRGAECRWRVNGMNPMYNEFEATMGTAKHE